MTADPPRPAAATDWCPVLLAARKAEARPLALARRAAIRAAGAGEALAAVLMAEAPAPPPGSRIAGYWPMGTEIDIRPALHAYAARGHGLALPVTPRRGERLRFRAWQVGAPLVAGPFGTRQPPPEAEEVEPDLLLVPLLAFDAAGRRLGYGAGYYDRTLAALAMAPRIGVGFAAQEVPEVPAGPDDVPLALVATERGLRRLGPSATAPDRPAAGR
jgi:5-formyltetrahydrofolate cyclo-ligase